MFTCELIPLEFLEVKFLTLFLVANNPALLLVKAWGALVNISRSHSLFCILCSIVIL